MLYEFLEDLGRKLSLSRSSSRRGEPFVVRRKVHVISITDMLADLLLALAFETVGVFEKLIDVLP